MIADPYSERVRELFANPAHAGQIQDAVLASVDDQGVRIELSARCREDRLEALRFRAWGCPHFLAAAEAFCRDYEGRDCARLAGFGVAEIMQTLPVPTEKTGRILVLEDAVRLLARRVGSNPEK
jgi:NifU-like protein involved in Fe-S cluster formation